VRLADRAWSEIRPEDCVLAVPLGSTEQHGPHLPLSTDTDIALWLCDALARSRPDVVVAPPVAYGSAGEHAGFPGTLSVGAAVTEHLLVELGRSADGFGGVLFVSAHGGNAGALAAAQARLRSESRRVRAWAPTGAVDAHAGRTETSVMLALRPEAVRLEVAAAGCTAPLAEVFDRLRTDGVRSVSANGVLGDPAGASAEEGRQVLARWASDLVTTLAGWPCEAGGCEPTGGADRGRGHGGRGHGGRGRQGAAPAPEGGRVEQT
jgi:mycofactocin system creatininase family protein